MPVTIKRQYDFSGGVNTTDLEGAPNEFGSCRNVRLFGRALKERGGQTKLNGSAVQSGAAVHSLFRFYRDDGSTRYLIGFAGTRMLEMKASPGNWESSPTSFTSGAKMDAATMDNTFYFGNGTDGMKSTTAPGGALTAVSGAPNANLITSVPSMNRLFASEPNSKRMSYTALLDSADWTTANDAGFFDVPFTEGENIKAHAAIPNGVLAIFSNSSFHTLSGTDPSNFVRREVDPSIGCKAPRSIAAGRGGIYFLANNNRVYWTDGRPPVPVSRNIESYLDEGSTGDYVNSVGWVEGTRYHLAISVGGGNNDVVLVKDWSSTQNPQGGWTIDDNIAVASVAVDDGLEGQVYTGDYSGFVQQQDTGTTDNGTVVNSTISTFFDTYDEEERRKKTKRTYVKFEPLGGNPMTVAIAKDGGPLETVASVSMASGASALDDTDYALDDTDTALDGGASEKTQRVSIIRNARSIKHCFSWTSPFVFYGYSTLMRKKFPK